MKSQTIHMEVNGQTHLISVRTSDTLLHILRNGLGLTGAKPGCLNGDCGACTVNVEGWPMKSCLMLAVEAEHKKIMTIEGLKDSPIQNAFVDHFAFQCGYCTSGFIMNCHSLIERYPDADEETIKEWLSSNICRCTGYAEISNAIHSVLKNQTTPRKD